MTTSAIGSIGAMSIGSISGFGSASPINAASSGDLAGSQGTNEMLMQLLDLINKSSLSPSSKVAISDAATGMLQSDSSSSNGASMADLSQALIVALMLQLLKV